MEGYMKLKAAVVGLIAVTAVFAGFVRAEAIWETDTNTFLGASAGAAHSGTYDTFVGYQAGMTNTTPAYNSFFGAFAGRNITTGAANSFLGAYAGKDNTTGSHNAFIGADAGSGNTTGGYNIIVGNASGYFNSSGARNSFLGYRAAYNNSTGSDNAFVGYEAGRNNGAGNFNTYVGQSAGYLSTGDGNVFIGNGAGYNELNSNRLYIANAADGFPLVYGEFDNRTLSVYGTLTLDDAALASDGRYKKNIQPLGSSLDKVMGLAGVSYEWKTDQLKGRGFREGRQIGLIAQEVEKVLPELVHTDSKGYKAISYDKLAPVLIEAMKEQQKEIKDKDAEIKELRMAVAELIGRVSALESSGRTVAAK